MAAKPTPACCSGAPSTRPTPKQPPAPAVATASPALSPARAAPQICWYWHASNEDTEVSNGYLVTNTRDRGAQEERAVAIGPALSEGAHAWMLRFVPSGDASRVVMGVCAAPGRAGRLRMGGFRDRAWGFVPSDGCSYTFECASEGAASRGSLLTEDGVSAVGETIHFRADLQRRTLEVRVGFGSWATVRDSDGAPVQLPAAVAPWVQLSNAGDSVELYAHGTGTAL